jgi:hypothetical protein
MAAVVVLTIRSDGNAARPDRRGTEFVEMGTEMGYKND